MNQKSDYNGEIDFESYISSKFEAHKDHIPEFVELKIEPRDNFLAEEYSDGATVVTAEFSMLTKLGKWRIREVFLQRECRFSDHTDMRVLQFLRKIGDEIVNDKLMFIHNVYDIQNKTYDVMVDEENLTSRIVNRTHRSNLIFMERTDPKNKITFDVVSLESFEKFKHWYNPIVSVYMRSVGFPLSSICKDSNGLISTKRGDCS